MAKVKRNHAREGLPNWPELVVGAKYVRLLQKQLDGLRQEPAHGNQRLFLDDVFIVQLLAFFTPSIRSLRCIEDFSQTRQAQQHLSIRKIAKSTLSDFHQMADPQRLVPIITALKNRVRRKHAIQKSTDDLSALLKQTLAVDGTWLPAMADVAWSVANSNNHGSVRHRARIDAQVNVETWLPEVLVVPEPEQSEAESASQHIQSGRISVYDRGYMSFALLKAHSVHPHSSFVVRFKPVGANCSALRDTTAHPLTNEDLAAGVVSDQTGYFITDASKLAGIEQVELREVIVEFQDGGKTKQLRLITDLLGISAQTVALLYRQRWQVELFFRWFKSLANFRHLISHTREGMLTQLYVAIIAAMLMYLHTGHRPSKYLFSLLSQVVAGGATLDEVIPILRERERRSELDRQSRARRAAKKQQEG